EDGRRRPSLVDAPADELDERRPRLEAFGGEGGLDIGEELRAVVRVGLCTLHEPGDLSSGSRELLRCFHPPHRCGRQYAQKLGYAFLVVSAHRSLRSLDAVATGFLPSSRSRRRARQREMRLAIVPEGR